MLEPKVDRIRPSLYGSLKLRPIAGRAHDFGFGMGKRHSNSSCSRKAADIIASMGEEMLGGCARSSRSFGAQAMDSCFLYDGVAWYFWTNRWEGGTLQAMNRQQL